VRGQELIASNSAPHDLSTVSRDNKNDGDVIPDISIIVSSVGAAPTDPAVEFCEVGVGVSWDRHNSTTTMPLVLSSSCGALPVVVFGFSTVRTRSFHQFRCSSPSLTNSGLTTVGDLNLEIGASVGHEWSSSGPGLPSSVMSSLWRGRGGAGAEY
jgi:hypothetical protein